jgi:hypothetical protein
MQQQRGNQRLAQAGTLRDEGNGSCLVGGRIRLGQAASYCVQLNLGLCLGCTGAQSSQKLEIAEVPLRDFLAFVIFGGDRNPQICRNPALQTVKARRGNANHRIAAAGERNLLSNQ